MLMLGYPTITQPPFEVCSKLGKCWISFQPPQNLPNISLCVIHFMGLPVCLSTLFTQP